MRGLAILIAVASTTRTGAADTRLAQPGPRVAATSAPSLAWRAPASCPPLAELRARVELRLERSLDDAVVGVEVDVTHARGRYVARIDLGAVTVANDVRTLTSRRCGELTDAVAVIVARVAGEAIAKRGARRADDEALDHDAIAKQRVALRIERDRSDAPEVDRTYTRSSPSATTPRRWTIGARLSGVSGIGVLPKVGLGGELALTLRYDRHLAEIAATRWVTSAAQFHDGAPAKVDVDLDVAVARYGWRPYELPLRAWIATEVGSMRGDGVDLPSQQFEGGRWIAAGAGFGIAWQMTPWIRLLGTTETMLALERMRFSTGEGLVVYAPAPMSFRTTVGLEVGWQ